MTLSQIEWMMLETVAALGSGTWMAGDRLLEAHSGGSGTVRRLARAGLFELTPADLPETLPSGKDCSAWATRLTPLGHDALRYRARHEDPAVEARPGPERAPVPGVALELRGADIELLRQALADAKAGVLTGVDSAALDTVLATALPVPGSRRHTVRATETELTAIVRVLYLESLYRDASGYNRLLRFSRQAGLLRPEQV
ncbi:hypothetical protein [Kitasatospora sp. NPDC006786]|uniref:hypothetical protein n=1 Tax=unclassified Kitasatospora TaxID=2633591 RepID=UPI0033C917AE